MASSQSAASSRRRSFLTIEGEMDDTMEILLIGAGPLSHRLPRLEGHMLCKPRENGNRFLLVVIVLHLVRTPTHCDRRKQHQD